MTPHPLLQIALIGTGKQAGEMATGAPTDALVEQVAGDSAEERLLLAAGAWSLYAQAGQVPAEEAAEISACPAEVLPACSTRVALLLRDMLAGHYAELMPEVLSRMQQAGKRVPHGVLPEVLDARTNDVRQLLEPVLGERGRWLGTLNPKWAWAAKAVAAGQEELLPADAETVWLEGSLAQREDMLRRKRAVDPGGGREWLLDVWKQEKAEPRSRLLAALECGLGADDEGLFEDALSDRSGLVRSVASRLAARLAGSAFAGRMRQRADSLLTAGGKKLLSRKQTLTVEPPVEVDKAWQRDCMQGKPPAGTGERAWQVTQTLGLVPPGYFGERFEQGPEELIEAVSEDAYAEAVIEGWCQAALLFEAGEWLGPLWDWWQRNPSKTNAGRTKAYEICGGLIRAMPAADAEQRVLLVLQGKIPGAESRIKDLLEQLPQPWPLAVGRAYLKAMRAEIGHSRRRGMDGRSQAWLESLPLAAAALPPDSFHEAEDRLPEFERRDYVAARWAQAYDRLLTALQIRKALLEEISK